MSPNARLSRVLNVPSYLDGGTSSAFGDFDPLSQDNPRLDCADAATLDYAIRATLRVSKMTLTLSYDTSITTTITYDNGQQNISTAPGPSGSATQDFTARQQLLAGSGPFNLDENLLLVACQGVYPSPTDEHYLGGGVLFAGSYDTGGTRPNYLATMILLNAGAADGALPYAFTFLLLAQFNIPGGGATGDAQIGVSSTGVDSPGAEQAIPFTFLGKEGFLALGPSGKPPPDSGQDATGNNPVTTTTTYYTATKLVATPAQFWSYDGKYDVATGLAVA